MHPEDDPVLINRSIFVAILWKWLYVAPNVFRGGMAAQNAATARVVSQSYAKGESRTCLTTSSAGSMQTIS